mgnify:CR=1 FL=1
MTLRILLNLVEQPFHPHFTGFQDDYTHKINFCKEKLSNCLLLCRNLLPTAAQEISQFLRQMLGFKPVQNHNIVFASRSAR